MAESATGRGLIVSSNELIHAKYHFSLWQKRVFMYFVSQIGKEASDFGLQKVYIADLVRFFESDQNGTVTDIIENVPRQLYETSIQVPSRDMEGNERFGEVRLVTKYTKPQDKNPGNAYIELKFNEDLKPHLLDLKKHFSKYELRNIVHLQSAHGIRIYEILKSRQYQKQIDLDVDYLKVILEVSEKYKLYGDFKRKIIDKARADLAQFCDIGFSYQEIKSGKKVVTLRLTIFENKPGEKSAPPPRRASARAGKAAPKPAEGPETDTERDALFMEMQGTAVGEWGVSPSRLLDLVRAHEPDSVRQAFRVTKRRAASGTLGNRAGFFVEAVQKGFTDDAEATAQRTAHHSAEQAEKEAKLEALKMQLDALVDTMRGELNATIRRLIEADGSARSRAIGAVRATQNPILKKEMTKLGGEPTAQDFRENPKLREAVVWEIVGQNAVDFGGTKERFAPEVAALVKVLGKRAARFEVLRFLGLES